MLSLPAELVVTAGKSLLLSLRNVYETLSISAPTALDAVRGTVTRQVCNERLEAWASRLVANNEMMVTVAGREHVDPARLGHGPAEGSHEGKRAYVVMSNHQSHYDVAVLFYVLGSNLRMVAKSELFELPFFGTAMKAAGFVSIDRGNRASAIASLGDARRALEAGVPIWIAPEGTRSTTGELLPFKKGGFALAISAGAPILPLSIRGTRDALRAKDLRSRKGAEIYVTIHPPVDPSRFADLSPKEARSALSDEVRRAIASGL